MRVNHPVTNQEKRFPAKMTLSSVTDMNGVIQYVNKEFIHISGYSEDELLGENHNLIRHPDMPPAAFEHMWQTIKADKPWRGMVKNRCKNGDHYWVDAYVTPVFKGKTKTGYQSVRSCPSRQQVEQAEALYEKMRGNSDMPLPEKWRLKDQSLKMKTSLLLGVLFFCSLASVFLGSSHLGEVNDALQSYVAGANSGNSSDSAPLDNLYALSESNATFKFLTWLLSALAIASTAALWFIFNQGVTGNLRRLVRHMREMASGSFATNIDIDQKDEIGEGFMTLKLLQARLKTVLGQFSESTEHLLDTAKVVADAGNTTLHSMEKQNQETEQVATAMNEMSATVQEVASNTVGASEASAQVSADAESGAQNVHSTRTSIESLSKEVEKSAGVINKLAEDSDKITTITNTISSIAEQTNLLALNAAIEAARAGEQGRGFAVVADEVRSLASRTQEATNEIREMIDNLQKGIGSSVAMMQSSMARATNAVESVYTTEQSFSSITSGVNHINDMSLQIATAAEQQSAVAEEMNRNIQTISEQAEKTSEEAQHTKASSDTVTSVAENLKGQLSHFDLGERIGR